MQSLSAGLKGELTVPVIRNRNMQAEPSHLHQDPEATEAIEVPPPIALPGYMLSPHTPLLYNPVLVFQGTTSRSGGKCNPKNGRSEFLPALQQAAYRSRASYTLIYSPPTFVPVDDKLFLHLYS